MSILAMIAAAALVGTTAELNESDRSVVLSASIANTYQPYPSWDDLGIDTNGWRGITYTFTGYGLVVPPNAETVTTVTNVATNYVQISEQWENLPAPLGAYSGGTIHSVAYGRYVPVYDKTQRLVTTTVTRIFTLTITYRGKERKLVHEEIVSQTVKKYAKKEEWEEVQ